MAEFTAGKMMTRQQASLNAPDSMGFDFAYGDAAYEAAMEASGTGMLGYTGYEGKNYETDITDIDDRLDDIKFLHSPYVERSPAGGWPMKYALLGEFNPTMSSVIGTKTGYGAKYDKEAPPDAVSEEYSKAAVPDTAAQQWAMSKVPESRNIGAFYKGKETVVEPARRFPPPTRYQSYTPNPPKPDPPFDCSMRPNRQNESILHPDPAWGYTGERGAAHARPLVVGGRAAGSPPLFMRRRAASPSAIRPLTGSSPLPVLRPPRLAPHRPWRRGPLDGVAHREAAVAVHRAALQQQLGHEEAHRRAGDHGVARAAQQASARVGGFPAEGPLHIAGH